MLAHQAAHAKESGQQLILGGRRRVRREQARMLILPVVLPLLQHHSHWQWVAVGGLLAAGRGGGSRVSGGRASVAWGWAEAHCELAAY